MASSMLSFAGSQGRSPLIHARSESCRAHRCECVMVPIVGSGVGDGGIISIVVDGGVGVLFVGVGGSFRDAKNDGVQSGGVGM